MQTEQEIESACIKWANSQDDLFAFKFPRGQKSYSRRNTVTASGNGVSDIVLNMTIYGIMFTCYIEVKKPGGKLRTSQYEFQDRITKMGGHCATVFSLPEFKERVTELRKVYIDDIAIAKIPW